MGRTKDLARIAVVTALYVALTMAIPALSYGQVQFRFAEVFVLLTYYNRKYAYSSILGCFIVNFFSPMFLVDVLFGTAASVLACVCIRLVKNLWAATLFPTLFCVFIGAELYFVLGEPFWLSTLTVMAGEFVVVTVLGGLLFTALERNKAFLSLIGADERFFDRFNKNKDKEN